MNKETVKIALISLAVVLAYHFFIKGMLDKMVTGGQSTSSFEGLDIEEVE